MNKVFTTIICVCFFMTASAQHHPNLEGAYSGDGGSQVPEGRAKLFILANNTYVIAFFGGVQVGKIHIGPDSMVTFSPVHYPHDFAIWGRHNKQIGDSVRMYFRDFERTETFIGLNKSTGMPALQRVFNPSPNCFSHPYIHKFNTKVKTITFSSLPYPPEEGHPAGDVYQFVNKEGYNDFVAYYFEKEEDNRPFHAKLENGELTFIDSEFSKKYPLPKGEDLKFIHELSATISDELSDTLLFNPFYNNYQKNVHDKFNYRYDTAKNAYINFPNYEEGEEYMSSEEGYNRPYVLYPFKQLKQFEKEKKQFTIVGKPLFVVKCREDE